MSSGSRIRRFLGSDVCFVATSSCTAGIHLLIGIVVSLAMNKAFAAWAGFFIFSSLVALLLSGWNRIRTSFQYGYVLGIAGLIHLGNFLGMLLLQWDSIRAGRYPEISSAMFPLCFFVLFIMTAAICIWHKLYYRCPRESEFDHLSRYRSSIALLAYWVTVSLMGAFSFGYGVARFGNGHMLIGSCTESLLGCFSAVAIWCMLYPRIRWSCWGFYTSLAWGALLVIAVTLMLIKFWGSSFGSSVRYQLEISTFGAFLYVVTYLVAFSSRFWLLHEGAHAQAKLSRGTRVEGRLEGEENKATAECSSDDSVHLAIKEKHHSFVSGSSTETTRTSSFTRVP